MGFLALFGLLGGRGLVNEVTWPQAIEAKSIVYDDGHFSIVGQTLEYSEPIQRVPGRFVCHTVFIYASCTE